jgi:hypothetical protein
MAKVVIPYKPRPIWKEVIHPALDKKKRAVLVCHRRFGKTVGCINQLIKEAVMNKKRAPQYAYIAPYRNQAKLIAWEYLKYYTGVIPGLKKNESDLYVELPSQHAGSPGARIYIVGADKPDALRGRYMDGVILDEYAQIKPGLYGEVVAPMLADRDGFAYFIGTPKGQNAFYERYLRALKDDRYFTCLYRVDETGVLSQEKIDEMKSEMTPEEVRQELYCDFTASASNVVIPIDIVTEAAGRTITEAENVGAISIMGVDVARFGDDDTIITHRLGLACMPQIKLHGLNTMEVASAVASHYWRIKPDAVVVDAGAMGAGVIDRLRQMGIPNVFEVNFGASAIDSNRYANIRAEMYFKLLDWLKHGGALPDDMDLKTELTVTEYKFTSAGKIILQPKELIKDMTGRSPDRADSLALTFAVPIVKTPEHQRVVKANTDFDFGFNDKPRKANVEYSFRF